MRRTASHFSNCSNVVLFPHPEEPPELVEGRRLEGRGKTHRACPHPSTLRRAQDDASLRSAPQDEE
ncbi:hypothetical protein OHAE_435 [Ochrobactrum soli]|uniref:Uncharacterized protein n=1 Tax=Ochrobactrum soli TaxID=2448455 RepID=A0A2P9HKF8_9HYPH|nr:hypothetical protein OHAE_435 [[Ochrobactrum] soli]